MDPFRRYEVRPIRARRLRGRKTRQREIMFTGIVQESGRALEFREDGGAWRLQVRTTALAEASKVGDSIAVNGVCLTVAAITGRTLRFDVLGETRKVTNLRHLESGALVNLEPALRFGGRIGGHFVTGHVDTLGKIQVFEQRGADWYLQVQAPREFLRYATRKGSVAIDGISLTLADPGEDHVAVWIIPHTREVTNLAERKAGQWVNLEFDMLAKYAERLLGERVPAPPAPAMALPDDEDDGEEENLPRPGGRILPPPPPALLG
jgi:riboflavin synthase